MRAPCVGQFEIEDSDTEQSGITALDEGFDSADMVIAETNRRAGFEAV